MIVPALSKNSLVLFQTARATCDTCGTLYAGISKMNAACGPFRKDRLKIHAVTAAAITPIA